jgi:RNA polymerase sigma factor (sigma-70 family)
MMRWSRWEGAGVDAPPELVVFCEREHPRLVRLLDLYVGDVGVAEELAQEALLRACERWQNVGGLTDPGAWLRTVGMNLARSDWRRRAAERRARARQVSFAGVPEGSGDAEEALVVRAALQRLPERQRRVLVLRYYAGLSYEEVAGVIGGTPGAARVVAHRAVKVLRELLGSVADFPLEEVGP